MARIDKTNLTRFTQNIKTYIANLFKSPNFGTNNTNSGDNSTVLGINNNNTAKDSLQAGGGNTNSGRYVLQWGYSNTNTNGYAAIGGKFNENKEDTLFEIGNGKTSKRSTAFEVYLDGRAKVYGVPTEETDVVRKKELDEKQATLTSETVLGKINGTDFKFGGEINIAGGSGESVDLSSYVTESKVNTLINQAISGALEGSY